MDNAFIFRRLLNLIIILMFPVFLRASTLMEHKQPATVKSALPDSVSRLPQEKEKKKNDDKGKQEKDVPDIREIPKAKKQSRPIVIKPNIKGKPIKVIRPKIKRP
ncbi:hypothetical protein D3C86_1530020 [compost metagenome]